MSKMPNMSNKEYDTRTMNHTQAMFDVLNLMDRIHYDNHEMYCEYSEEHGVTALYDEPIKALYDSLELPRMTTRYNKNSDCGEYSYIFYIPEEYYDIFMWDADYDYPDAVYSDDEEEYAVFVS